MSGKGLDPIPTDAELGILRVLWRRGPSTVREVHAALSGERSISYNTVLKLLMLMLAKGLVTRNDTARAHVYQARQSEEQTQRGLVTDLLDRAFGGSAEKLVMQALAVSRVSAQELVQIRKFLDESAQELVQIRKLLEELEGGAL